MRALALAFLIACNAPAVQPPAGSPEALAGYLRGMAGTDQPTRQRAVTGWILDEPAFDRIIVTPYQQLWKDYAAHFDAKLPPLVAQLASHGAITTRRHYAGDPRLTNAQVRVRWALPVQYPSVVAELDGSPIDTVFVWDGSGWRVLAGLDDLLIERVRALDAHCANLLVKSGPPNNCTEVGWFVADSALKQDQASFARACKLAASVCGNDTP